MNFEILLVGNVVQLTISLKCRIVTLFSPPSICIYNQVNSMEKDRIADVVPLNKEQSVIILP